MNSGRIALGFLITAIAVMALFFGMTKLPTAYAATNYNSSTTAQVIVNGFVSITLGGVPIYFSPTDPGTANVAANATGGWPMTVQVDLATNVGTDVYMNGTNFSNAPIFGIGMMRFNVSNSSTSIAKNSSCAAVTAPCNYTITPSALFNETARLGTAATTSIYNWVTVPGIAAGTYANNIKVCATQWQTGGC